jgi:hypothetical protein
METKTEEASKKAKIAITRSFLGISFTPKCYSYGVDFD